MSSVRRGERLFEAGYSGRSFQLKSFAQFEFFRQRLKYRPGSERIRNSGETMKNNSTPVAHKGAGEGERERERERERGREKEF